MNSSVARTQLRSNLIPRLCGTSGKIIITIPHDHNSRRAYTDLHATLITHNPNLQKFDHFNDLLYTLVNSFEDKYTLYMYHKMALHL